MGGKSPPLVERCTENRGLGERKMVLSINTNLGAMVALQHLNSTNSMLENTQLRITTGLRVNGPKDDASTYAIAQNMRAISTAWWR
jgi:hypothetical protein